MRKSARQKAGAQDKGESMNSYCVQCNKRCNLDNMYADLAGMPYVYYCQDCATVPVRRCQCRGTLRKLRFMARSREYREAIQDGYQDAGIQYCHVPGCNQIASYEEKTVIAYVKA